MGVADSTPERVAQNLVEGVETFDRAVKGKRTPFPFGHKMHPHLRPYFVDGYTSLYRGRTSSGSHALAHSILWVGVYDHAG